MSALVERQLNYFGAQGVSDGVVQLFSPQEDRGAWRCDYRLSWPGFDKTRGAMGEDQWQALHLAMHVVPAEIFATDDFKQGRIGLWGHKFTSYEDICELFDVKPVEGPTK